MFFIQEDEDVKKNLPIVFEVAREFITVYTLI